MSSTDHEQTRDVPGKSVQRPARIFREWPINQAGDFRLASENSGSPALGRQDGSPMPGQAGTCTESSQVHAIRQEETGVTINSHLPDITRPDVGTVLVSEWTVGTPERQRALVEAFAAAWERRGRRACSRSTSS
jgi:hypothetical protein